MDGSALAQIIPLVLIVAVFWLLIVRPQRKRQQAMRKLRSSVEVGDSVLLGSGLYGTVRTVSDGDLRLEIAPDVVVRVHRDAVVSVEERPGGESDTGTDSGADHGASDDSER